MPTTAASAEWGIAAEDHRQIKTFGSSPEVRAALDSCQLFSPFASVYSNVIHMHVYLFGIFVV